jgi:hypothetical protein
MLVYANGRDASRGGRKEEDPLVVDEQRECYESDTFREIPPPESTAFLLMSKDSLNRN